jgi:DNA-binding transcriptional ArsR family regulator
MLRYWVMDVFTALADPIRRDIVDVLAQGDEDAGSIASRFAVSRPAISRHLRVLREAGIVEARPDAQRRVYRLRPDALMEVGAWLAKYRRFWPQRLEMLAAALERDPGQNPTAADDDR